MRTTCFITALLSLIFCTLARAEESVEKLLDLAIRKAVFGATPEEINASPALSDKSVADIKLLFELGETAKVMKTSQAVFSFLEQSPIPAFAPQSLAGNSLTAFRNLDARKSAMLTFLAQNGAGEQFKNPARNDPGHSVLFLAARMGGSQCVKAVLEAGGDAQAVGEAGVAALHAAAGNAWLFPDSVRVLIEAGAKPSAWNGSDALTVLLQNYSERSFDELSEAERQPVAPVKDAYSKAVENCAGSLELLTKATKQGSPTAAKLAIERGHAKALAKILVATPGLDGEQAMKWLISAKLQNPQYPEAGYTSVKASITAHREAQKTKIAALPKARAWLLMGFEIWMTDGTEEGTSLIHKAANQPMKAQATENGLCYFELDENREYQLYCCPTSGAKPEHLPLGDFQFEPLASASSGGRMIFRLIDRKKSRNVLWQTDGTRNGTVRVKDDDLNVIELGTRNNRVLFDSRSPTNPNIYSVFEIKPATRTRDLLLSGNRQSQNSHWSGGLNGCLPVGKTIFRAGRERGAIVATNIEGKGESLVLESGLQGLQLEWEQAVEHDGRLFAQGNFTQQVREGAQMVSKHGSELYRVGSGEGDVTLVADIQPGKNGSSPYALCSFGKYLLFFATDEVHGAEPRAYDGNTAYLLKDIHPNSGSSLSGFVPLGKVALFFARGRDTEELWKTDGTPEGTAQIRAVKNPGRSLMNAGACVYFSATDGDGKPELWRSDGTIEGTRVVKTLPGQPVIFTANSREAAE